MRRAFTLLEVVVAAGVLAVAVVAFLDLFRHQSLQAAHTRARALALGKAQGVLARFADAPCAVLRDRFGDPGRAARTLAEDPLLKRADEAVPPAERVIALTCTAGLEECREAPGLWRFSVRVDWKEPSLPAASLTLSRVVVDHRALHIAP